jgi:CheY-like chemotaxis protein
MVSWLNLSTVEVAEDGEASVAAAARTAFDLMLMDIQLPGIDGVETTRQIRALGGHNATIPVIAVTAHVLPSQAAWLIGEGLDDYMAKPVFPRDLMRMLEKWRARIRAAVAA